MAVAYAAPLMRYAFAFRRLFRQPALLPDPLPRVTVLVPARDEAATIESCLVSILGCDYPLHLFEILVMDDFSSDDTAERVEALHDEFGDSVRLIRMADVVPDEDHSHKGVALTWGLHFAEGSIILTTDADCTVAPGWIKTMVQAFSSPRVVFVAGPVRMAPAQTLLEKYQATEFAGLIALGAGALASGVPNMCNSANLAYRKKIFEALKLVTRSEQPTPWDDELLLLRIKRHPELEARFCPLPDALVTTAPEPGFRGYMLQRWRWAATGARYPGTRLALFVRFVYVFHLVMLVALVAAAFAPALWPFVGAAFLVKIIAEAALVLPALRRYGQGRLRGWFFPFQPFEIVQVLIFGAAGMMGRPAWKGRELA